MTSKRILAFALMAMALTACKKDDGTSRFLHPVEKLLSAPPPVIRQPVLPELLKPCRGHVLVPALGMAFVASGTQAPGAAQFLREERLTAPYRVIKPQSRVTQDHNPERLNVEVDSYDRVVGLYCG